MSSVDLNNRRLDYSRPLAAEAPLNPLPTALEHPLSPYRWDNFAYKSHARTLT